MEPSQSRVKHPEALFVGLTIGLTLLVATPWVLATRGVLPAWMESLSYVGAFAPSVAGLLAAGIAFGRAGVVELLRRTVQVRFPLHVWLACLVGPGVAIGTGAVIAVALLGAPEAALNINALALFPVLVLTAFLISGGLTEELGWRGFMLRLLLARGVGALRASVIVGLPWWLWHGVLLLREASAIDLVRFVTLFLATTLCVSVVMTWVYRTSKGSVLACAIFHGAMNGTALTMTVAYGMTGEGPLDAEVIRLTQVALLIAMAPWALGVIALHGRRRLARPQNAQRPAN